MPLGEERPAGPHHTHTSSSHTFKFRANLIVGGQPKSAFQFLVSGSVAAGIIKVLDLMCPRWVSWETVGGGGH